MGIETKIHELGAYGFQLNLHIVRNEPWPDGAIAMARRNPDLPPGASDLEAVARMLTDVCGNVLSHFCDEHSMVFFDSSGQPERD